MFEEKNDRYSTLLSNYIHENQNYKKGINETAIKDAEKAINSIKLFDDYTSKAKEFSMGLFNILRDSRLGEEIYLYDNKIAANKEDKSRYFLDIFYYPKGRNRNEWGFNTPVLEFEATPRLGKITVKSRTTINPQPMKGVRVLDINFINPSETETEIKKYILNFFKAMAALTIRTAA